MSLRFLLDTNSTQQVLYIADDNEIRSLDPGMPHWRYEQTFQGDASVRIDAMDLHIKTNRIFWTSWHTRQISSYELPGTSSSSISSNSHRNRRLSEGRVTNLQVTLITYMQEGQSQQYEKHVTTFLLTSRLKGWKCPVVSPWTGLQTTCTGPTLGEMLLKWLSFQASFARPSSLEW